MEKKKVFFIMPFEEKFFEVYEVLKRTFEKDFTFSNAGEEDNQQNILKDIIQSIYEADIVVADLTGLNPNVFYELGIAHTLNKKTIIITENIEELPFDLSSYRVKEYSTHFSKFAEFQEAVGKYLNGAVSGETSFGNPVNDFLSSKDEQEVALKIYSQETEIVLNEESDQGFLDFLAEIEDSSEKLNGVLNEINKETVELSVGIKESNETVESVKKTGGSGTASFIRKEARKVAKLTNDYSSHLRAHNGEYMDLWTMIEKNTLGMINNPYASTNVEGLKGYLLSLKELKNAVKNARGSVYEMKESVKKLGGMERSLTQAVRFLEEDMDTFLSNLVQTTSSIDRILERGCRVVGPLEE